MTGNRCPSAVPERAYRLLLFCYPAEFRHEYSREMALAFRCRWRDERLRNRIFGPAWLWLEVLAEIAFTAPKEHLDMLQQDIRYAIRLLAQNPAFTAVAVLTLALGIGANTAIFSVLDSMVLHPLPFADSGRLVQIWEGDRRLGVTNWESNAPDFLDWQRLSGTLEQIAGYQQASFSLTGSGAPEQIDGARVTGNFFATLGVHPLLGRISFTPDEDRSGAPVAILRYGRWKTTFNGDPGIVGKTVALDGLPRSIIGVAPESFAFPHLGPAGFFVPMAFTAGELQSRRMHWLYVIGRLRPGATLAHAQSEMDGIADRLKKEHPDTNRDSGVIVISLAKQTAGVFGPALWTAFGAVGFVLLIACANIANLLLARSSVRQREIGVRMVLGANRARISRQLLTESVVLFSVGAIAGIAAAVVGIRLLVNAMPLMMRDYMPHSADLRVNLLTLGFTVAVTLAAAIASGLAPALAASRQEISRATREGGSRNTGGRRGRIYRGFMIVGEAGLAVVLAIMAGLLARTFLALQTSDHGFRPDHVVTMSVQLPAARYRPGAPIVSFYDQLLDRGSHLPGVAAVGVVDFLPFLGANTSDEFAIDGVPASANSRPPGARIRSVSSGYFDAMRIPLIHGRVFAPGDDLNSARVVLVSQAMVRQHFHVESPIGRRIRFNAEPNGWREIVGVVGDVKHTPTEQSPAPYIYLPYSQRRSRSMTVVARAAGDPSSLTAALRTVVSGLDQSLPVANTFTMREVMSISTMPQGVSSVLVTAFGALAILLMTVGIFGVTSYVVAQRTQEMGVRMALGASRAGVALLILRQSMMPVIAGLVLGILAAAGLARLLRTMLFGISPLDPLTFGCVTALMIAIAAVASLVPARRATTVDPVVALRYE